MMTIPPKTVAFSDSLSLSCMMFKILLPVISRGVSPHWVKSTPPNTDSSSSWTSRSKIKAPPPLHLHPPPGSTCRFSTSPQVLFEKKSEGTSILGWLRMQGTTLHYYVKSLASLSKRCLESDALAVLVVCDPIHPIHPSVQHMTYSFWMFPAVLYWSDTVQIQSSPVETQ